MSIVAILLGMAALILNDPMVTLPYPLADIWRIGIMLQAGYVFGMMILLIFRLSRIKIAKDDRLTHPAFAWMLSFFILCIYSIFTLSGYLGMIQISWRTPMLFIALTIADISVAVITSRFSRMIHKAKGGIFKLTVTNTNTPGHDVDLTGDYPVIHE